MLLAGQKTPERQTSAQAADKLAPDRSVIPDLEAKQAEVAEVASLIVASAARFRDAFASSPPANAILSTRRKPLMCEVSATRIAVHAAVRNTVVLVMVFLLGRKHAARRRKLRTASRTLDDDVVSRQLQAGPEMLGLDLDQAGVVSKMGS